MHSINSFLVIQLDKKVYDKQIVVIQWIYLFSTIDQLIIVDDFLIIQFEE